MTIKMKFLAGGPVHDGHLLAAVIPPRLAWVLSCRGFLVRDNRRGAKRTSEPFELGKTSMVDQCEELIDDRTALMLSFKGRFAFR